MTTAAMILQMSSWYAPARSQVSHRVTRKKTVARKEKKIKIQVKMGAKRISFSTESISFEQFAIDVMRKANLSTSRAKLGNLCSKQIIRSKRRIRLQQVTLMHLQLAKDGQRLFQQLKTANLKALIKLSIHRAGLCQWWKSRITISSRIT